MLPSADDLTPAEVAALCGRPVKTVHDWLRTGRLRGRKIGPRLWRIPRTEVEAFYREPGVAAVPMSAVPMSTVPTTRQRRRANTAAHAERGKAELRELGLMS